MATNVIIDIAQLYQRTFGSKPYVLNKDGELSRHPGEAYQIGSTNINAEQEFTAKGSLIKEQLLGVPIFLPVKFFDEKGLLMYLPYSVVQISGKKTIVKTPLAERVGTVKEQYSIEDYAISIKGFLIGENRKFPEAQLVALRELYERKAALKLENAFTNIFLDHPGLTSDEQRRVVITGFDLPEVQGGREHVRPFNLQVESDTVFTLEASP